jgi:hypothetical protein
MTTSQLRMVAKVGMTASLAALVISAAGAGNRRKRMEAHTWQGLALVGFSVWHYNLYPGTRTRICGGNE